MPIKGSFFKVLHSLKHPALFVCAHQATDVVGIHNSYVLKVERHLLTGVSCLLTVQFIASVLDIPDFNLLCERVPYVRDDPRQTRVGNVLGTETSLL